MRVVIADDSLLVRQGVAGLLAEAGIEVIGEAGDALTLHPLLAADPPDVAIVDIRMPPTHTDEGLVAAAAIREAHPTMGVLVLSQHVEPSWAVRLLGDHPDRIGYLLKEHVFSGAALADAVRRIAAGETVVDPAVAALLLGRQRRASPLDALTPREREVLALVAEGSSNRAIAERLHVTERTVEAHVTQVFLKLGLDEDASAHRRVQAVLAWLRG